MPLSQENLIKIHSWDYVKNFPKYENWRISRWLTKYLHFKWDRILEIWSGNWLLSIELEKENIESCIWVDFSMDFINEANNNKIKYWLSKSTFIHWDIISISQDYIDYFDKVFAIDFTEHIYDENFVAILNAVYKSLKKWWELIIHTPNKDFFLEILKDKAILRQEDGHIAVRTWEEYTSILENAWFNNITVHKINHYLNTLKLFHMFSHIPLIGKYFKARLLIICKK